MKQAVMNEPGRIEFLDIPDPVVDENEVLIRIKQIGVCGSDIHVYHGKHPFTSYPVVQGHEFSAVVVEAGKNAQQFKPGMKVTARPQVVCGECNPCRRGDYNICDVLKVQGFQAPGCAQEFFVTTPDKLVVLADTMLFEQGALVEPVAVAVHSTGRAGDLNGKNVVVLGAGTIGNLVAQVVRSRGASKVLITDVSDYRLEIARCCGISATSNAAEESLADAALRVFGNDGFMVAFEAAGAETAMDAGIQAIEKGGTIVVLGVFGDRPRIDMSVVGDHEISLVGTLMYKHEDYLRAVQLIADGDIITAPLVTSRFPFDRYLDAYRFIDEQRDRSMKVMIEME